MPAAAAALLAVVCLGIATVAMRPSPLGVAAALVVLLLAAPGAGALLVAAGPGPVGGESAITADVHVHAHLTAGESDITFRPGPRGNHYLTTITVPSRPPASGVALLVATAVVFVTGAVGHLHRRSAPAGPARGHGGLT